jgi:hypothetical protein
LDVVQPHPFGETKNLIAGWREIDVETYERALAQSSEVSRSGSSR